MYADTILHSKNIYAEVGKPKLAGSIALHSGRIAALGSTTEVSNLAGPGTEVIELEKRTVLPGLVDSHIHLAAYSRSLTHLRSDQPSLEQMLVELIHADADTPEGSWIIGHGWDQNAWGTWPQAKDLDRVASGRPVYLTAKSLHAAVASSSALRLAGIGQNTPDPDGGELQRDEEGNPTGVLFEGAMQLVESQIPAPTPEDLAPSLASAQSQLWRFGITGVHDFDGADCFAALQILHNRGALGLRVVKMLLERYLDQAAAIGLRSGFGDEWLRLGNVKVFTDGALGPRTAAMLEPYSDQEDSSGILLLDREQLTEIGLRAAQAGFGMVIHAIGDRANHEALEALHQLKALQPSFVPEMPHRIEHVQLLAQDDFDRLSTMGIVASMQPIHAVSDREMADRGWGDRVWRSYPWRTLQAAGTTLIFGSDAPVDSPNPFWGLHAAITRQPRTEDRPPWVADQVLTREEALRAYTVGPAFVTGASHEAGKLQPGYLADLIVLERDPFGVASSELPHLLPVGTMVDGIWRFRAFD